jgi:hypothetical protein
LPPVLYILTYNRPEGKVPPWSLKSNVKTLETKLELIENRLPQDFALSEDNVQSHAQLRTSTTYQLLHYAIQLCHIMLHREYVPFTPFMCDRPVGPIDEPTIPKEEVRPGDPNQAVYWEESAEKMFKAARSLWEILRACRDCGVLVETPLSAFAAFQVAIVGKQLET